MPRLMLRENASILSAVRYDPWLMYTRGLACSLGPYLDDSDAPSERLRTYFW